MRWRVCRALCIGLSTRYEVAGHFRGVNPLGVLDREGKVDTERDIWAERSALRSCECFLNGANASRGGESVGVSGLQPRFCGGAFRAGGTRPSRRPVGRGWNILLIKTSYIAGGRANGICNDVGSSCGIKGCLRISGGHGHRLTGSVGETDRRDAGKELFGNQLSPLTDPASVREIRLHGRGSAGAGWAEATRDANSR